jgi:hypothetical protein
MARTKDDVAVTWPGVSAAVALLTSLRGGSADSRAEILADTPPGEVLGALEIFAAVFLAALAPGELGDQVLELIGLAALETARDCRNQGPRMPGKGHTNPRDPANGGQRHLDGRVPVDTRGTHDQGNPQQIRRAFSERQGASERCGHARVPSNIDANQGASKHDDTSTIRLRGTRPCCLCREPY